MTVSPEKLDYRRAIRLAFLNKSPSLTIQKVFLYNAAYLIGIGLFWGNVLGLGLLALQSQTEWISLDPNSYYVTTVPIAFDLSMIVTINIGTFVICVLMLLIPSFIISKVTPIRALRRI